MGDEPGACSRSVPASGIVVQYLRLGEGAPAAPLSSSITEQCECSSFGRVKDVGRNGMGLSPCRTLRYVSKCAQKKTEKKGIAKEKNHHFGMVKNDHSEIGSSQQFEIAHWIQSIVMSLIMDFSNF